MHFCIPALKKKQFSPREGFYGLSTDSVISSNDKSFIELMEKDHFDQSVMFCVWSKQIHIKVH